MDQTERQALIEVLTASHERLLKLTEGLSEAQWRFRESPERWSIQDCLEHVALVDARVVGSIERVLAEVEEAGKARVGAAKDNVVRELIPNRATRVQAPEPVHPTGRWNTPVATREAFRAARGRTIEFASETDADLRSRAFKHVRLGEIDCYQWLLTMGYHGHRHAQQIEEVMAHHDYPAA